MHVCFHRPQGPRSVLSPTAPPVFPEPAACVGSHELCGARLHIRPVSTLVGRVGGGPT